MLFNIRHHLLLLALATLPFTTRAADLLLVVGAPGTEEYGRQFQEVAALWKAAAESSGTDITLVDSSKENAALEVLTQKLGAFAEPDDEPLWLVFVGHGTSDGRDSHFNLPGPDLSSSQLAKLLTVVKRELVIIDTTAASGAFIQALSQPGRTIVTATKGPDEVYFTRFGLHFARAIAGHIEADLDQDEQVSVLEAFLFAANETRQFYEKEDRIATEHALLDDNADKQGTRSESFIGLKAKPLEGVKVPEGLRAAQLHLVLNSDESKLSPETRATRDALEAKLRTLVDQKRTLPEADYYRQLEALLREIASLTQTSSG